MITAHKSIFSVLPVLLLFFAVCADADTRGGTTVLILSPEAFTRIGSDVWAAGGTGVSRWGMPGAPLSNPAGLDYPSLGFYLEGTQRFTTKWLADIDYDGQLIAPLFGSVGFPAGNFNLAFGYANVFDVRYSESVNVTTPNYPEGTGQTYDFGRSIKTHVFFGSASYPVGEELSAGLTVGIHYVHHHEDVFDLSANGGGIGLLLVGGALFRASDRVSIGGAIHYESPTTFTETYSVASLTPVSDTTRRITYVVESDDFTARFPWSVDLGMAWAATGSLSFMVGGEYQHWSNISESYKNLVQLHLGTEFAVSDQVRLAAGFFTQDAPEDIPGNPLVENFLTFGFRWKVSPAVNVSASVLDSHLLSSSPSPSIFGSTDERFRQSSVSIGISYTAPTP
jgi:long-subunit fatty acid transport protein